MVASTFNKSINVSVSEGSAGVAWATLSTPVVSSDPWLCKAGWRRDSHRAGGWLGVREGNAPGNSGCTSGCLVWTGSSLPRSTPAVPYPPEPERDEPGPSGCGPSRLDPRFPSWEAPGSFPPGSRPPESFGSLDVGRHIVSSTIYLL